MSLWYGYLHMFIVGMDTPVGDLGTGVQASI